MHNPSDPPAFPEQNWKGANFYPPSSPSRALVNNCLKSTNWAALLNYASALHNRLKCRVLRRTTNGQHHMICVLEFSDKTRWIARIQMQRSTERLAGKMQREVDVMTLMRERAGIAVPLVFGYETDDNNVIGVAFMLMEFLPGNVAIDADGGYEAHRGRIPLHRRTGFHDAVARIQVQMASVCLPKRGTIIRSKDGRYDVGPFPDIGGPFETATAFFAAWAAHARFPKSAAEIRRSMGNGPVEEVLRSIAEFPQMLGAAANRLSICDEGPFPVSHRDLLHSNIVVDGDYGILGVIDWEGACTVPWELVEFPLFLSTVPVVMDAAWNYDREGVPLDEETRRTWRERREYVGRVRRVEEVEGSDDMLSRTLANQNGQNLAYEMRAYLEPGKLGFYHRVIEAFDSQRI